MYGSNINYNIIVGIKISQRGTDCLIDIMLHNEGFVNPAPIWQKWSEHLSGQRIWQYNLWDILMFQAWL